MMSTVSEFLDPLQTLVKISYHIHQYVSNRSIAGIGRVHAYASMFRLQHRGYGMCPYSIHQLMSQLQQFLNCITVPSDWWNIIKLVVQSLWDEPDEAVRGYVKSQWQQHPNKVLEELYFTCTRWTLKITTPELFVTYLHYNRNTYILYSTWQSMHSPLYEAAWYLIDCM